MSKEIRTAVETNKEVNIIKEDVDENQMKSTPNILPESQLLAPPKTDRVTVIR